MKLSIFNVYVPMEDEAQCLRMKQLCVDEGLPIWEADFAFDFLHEKEVFGFDSKDSFFVMNKTVNDCLKHQVTEADFIKRV